MKKVDKKTYTMWEIIDSLNGLIDEVKEYGEYVGDHEERIEALEKRANANATLRLKIEWELRKLTGHYPGEQPFGTDCDVEGMKGIAIENDVTVIPAEPQGSWVCSECGEDWGEEAERWLWRKDDTYYCIGNLGGCNSDKETVRWIPSPDTDYWDRPENQPTGPVPGSPDTDRCECPATIGTMYTPPDYSVCPRCGKKRIPLSDTEVPPPPTGNLATAEEIKEYLNPAPDELKEEPTIMAWQRERKDALAEIDGLKAENEIAKNEVVKANKALNDFVTENERLKGLIEGYKDDKKWWENEYRKTQLFKDQEATINRVREIAGQRGMTHSILPNEILDAIGEE